MTPEAMAFLEADSIQNTPILTAIKRGTAQVLAEGPEGVLIRESIDGAYMVSAGSRDTLAALLRPLGRVPALLLCEEEFSDVAEQLCGVKSTGPCYQVVYAGPSMPLDEHLTFRTPGPRELDRIEATYDLLDRPELEDLARRDMLFCGYDGEDMVGYVGRHTDGSVGLLYVFPEFRMDGYGSQLSAFMVNRVLRTGEPAYGHIFEDNHVSAAMQRSMGWQFARRKICWLFPISQENPEN